MQIKYLVGSALIIGALGFLMKSSLQAGTLQSVPVAQLRAADAEKSFIGRRLRVVGFVGRAPVKKTPTQTSGGVINTAQFDVYDVVKGKQKVLVSYTDALPDTFRADGPVQVDGVYTAPGVMKADHVLTKCPSKYESGKGAEGENSDYKPSDAKEQTAKSEASQLASG